MALADARKRGNGLGHAARVLQDVNHRSHLALVTDKDVVMGSHDSHQSPAAEENPLHVGEQEEDDG